MDAARVEFSRSEPWARPRLGTLLLRHGLLSADQLEAALTEREETGRRLGEIVLENGLVSGRTLARLLAEQHELEFLDLESYEIDAAAVSLLPEKFARRYQALPLAFLAPSLVLVAVADPTDVVTSDDLRLALGLNVRLGVVDGTELERKISSLYRAAELEINEIGPASDDIRLSSPGSATAVEIVNSLIARAIDEDASDLHFEPQAGGLVIRARIDGIMRRLTRLPREEQQAVTSRLKVMAELDIAERRAPQDGRVSVRVDGRQMDLRIAVLPTPYGERVVLRVHHRARTRLGLPELGMSPETEETFIRAVREPYGAVIACGPTGSGKTTTLYAALDLLNDEGRVLTTIEDPIEYLLPGANQIEVQPRGGLTFARGLRTLLRSDPDVVLVGEVRDEETARIAIQAAMTGHLVLTSLHSASAASSIARLREMGVEPGLLVTTVNCIVAQRLARRLCLNCRQQAVADPEELRELGRSEEEEVVLYRPRGCSACAQTGYRGRVALYEVMPIEGRVRRAIERPTEEIFAAAVDAGMNTLRDDGHRLCLAGISSLEEVRRVAGERLR